MGFAAFAGHKYLNLETFKKSGEGREDAGLVCDRSIGESRFEHAKLYGYTIGVSGKVKRIRNSSRVRIAPCDMRGRVLGEWVEALAEIVTGEEAARGMQLLNRKYFPWKQFAGIFRVLQPARADRLRYLPSVKKEAARE